MKMIEFPAVPQSIPTALDFVNHNLKSKKITNSQIVADTSLILEEILVKLIEQTEDTETIGLRMGRDTGGFSVRITAAGKPFDLNNMDSDDPAYKILSRYEDKIRTRYKNGVNNIGIIGKYSVGMNCILALLAIVAAVLISVIMQNISMDSYNALADYVIYPLNSLFIGALNFIAPPITFLAIVLIIIRYRNVFEQHVLGKKLFFSYIITSLLAIGVGFFVSAIFSGLFQPMEDASYFLLEKASYTSAGDIVNELYNIVPESLGSFITSPTTLQILLLAIIFGLAASSISQFSDVIEKLTKALSELFCRVLSIIFSIAPIVAFTAAMSMIAFGGLKSMEMIMVMIIVILTGLFVMLVIYGLYLRIHGLSPIQLVKKYHKSMRVTFRIGSSIDAIPHTIRSCRRFLGIPIDILDFAVPFGANFNMDGNCIYLTVMSVFLLTVCEQQLSAIGIAVLIFGAFFVSLGAPNQPGSGVIGMSVLLPALGLSPMLLVMILCLDVLFSMFISFSNTLGDIVVIAVQAKKEGRIDSF